MVVSDRVGRLGQGHRTYAAVSTQGHRLCAVQPAGIDRILHDRVTYYRGSETRVEIGGVCEVDIVAPELVLISGIKSQLRGHNIAISFCRNSLILHPCRLDIGFELRIEGRTIRNEFQK